MARSLDNLKWKDAPTRTIDVGGVAFVFRELGTDAGVPLILLHHLMAVLDDWDPRVIAGIAAHRRVIAFDNRGVNDPMVDSRLSTDMARRLPNAQLTIYPDCGHGGVFQNYQAFVPAVRDFLSDDSKQTRMTNQ